TGTGTGTGTGTDTGTDSDTVFAYQAAPLGYYAVSVLRLHAGRGLVVLANGRGGDRVAEEVEARLRSVRRAAQRSPDGR
ncbi:hypothetical protein GTW67_36675, partial [Streptomyces sp. SID5910]|nr:hypothetical protein [Streptomyces sp. SID5910]